jgi:hypothetical protein
MSPANKIEFAAVLNGLAAIKPGAKLTPEALDVWWASMANWSIEDFRAAAGRLAKDHEFFPNPFHFEQLRKASRSSPGEAFARALEVARTESWRDMDRASSGDPETDAAVRACGGYRALALSDETKVGFLEKRFAEHYETIQDMEDVRESLPRIAGPTLHRGPTNGPKLLKDLT